MANPLPAEGGDAVRDLRRVFDAYQPLVPYYADYWLEHPDVSYAQYLDMTRQGCDRPAAPVTDTRRAQVSAGSA